MTTERKTPQDKDRESGPGTGPEAAHEDASPEARASGGAEASDMADSGEVASGQGGDLTAELETARAKADEHWDAFMRARAELENVRRRAERDVEQAHRFALEKFVGELLPVKDSLEMGIQAAGESDGQSQIRALREGSELTLKMFRNVLEKFGVEEVDPQGQTFNPDLHEAVSMQQSAEAEPGTVVAVMQKGYLLNKRVIRPAMVVVAQAPEGGARK